MGIIRRHHRELLFNGSDPATNLTATPGAARTMDLAWTDADEADEYGVERAEVDQDGNLVGAYVEIDRVSQGVGTFNDPFYEIGQYSYLAPDFDLPQNAAGDPLVHNANTDDIEGEIVDTSYRAAHSGTTWNVTAGDSVDLANTLDLASLTIGEDLIRIPFGNYTGFFTVPTRAGGAGALYIQVSDYAAFNALYPRNTRISPAARGSIPQFRIGAVNGTIWDMEEGCHDVRFVGLDLTNGPTHHTSTQLVSLRPASFSVSSVPADMVHRIVFDRCLAIPTVASDKIDRGFFSDGFDIAHIDGYYYGFYGGDPGADTQAIAWTNGKRQLVRNCRLTSGSENFASGGSLVLDGMELEDLEMRKCYLKKPAIWLTGGTGKLIKNLLEFKWVNRALVEDCILDGSVADAQSGPAVVFWSVNQTGTNPTATTKNITFRWNRIRNAGSGFQLADSLSDVGGANPSVPMSRVHLYQFSMEKMESYPAIFDVNGARTFQILAQTRYGIEDLHIDNVSGGDSIHSLIFNASTAQERFPGFRMRDCLLPLATYAVMSDRFGQDVLDAVLAPNYDMSGNFMAGDASVVPTAGTTRVASTAALGFEDYANGVLALAVGSPAIGAGRDGRNSGVDWTTLLARTAGVADDDYVFP